MTKIWIAKVKLSSDHYKPYFRLLIGSNVNRSSPICSLELIHDQNSTNSLASHRTKGDLTHFLAKLLIIGDYADENSPETSKNECLLFVWRSIAKNYGLRNGDAVKIRRLDQAPRLSKIFLRVLNEKVAEQLIDDLKNSDQSFICNENDYLWFKVGLNRKIGIWRCHPVSNGLMDSKSNVVISRMKYLWAEICANNECISFTCRLFLWIFRLILSRKLNISRILPHKRLETRILNQFCPCALNSYGIHVNLYILKKFKLKNDQLLTVLYENDVRKTVSRIVKCKLIKYCCENCRLRTYAVQNVLFVPPELYFNCDDSKFIQFGEAIPDYGIRFADEAKISMIICPNYEQDYDSTEILNEYFKTPKILKVNDIFHVTRPGFRRESCMEKSFVYFKVIELSSKKRNYFNSHVSDVALEACSSHFHVDQKYTTLKQISNIHSTVIREWPFEEPDFNVLRKQLNAINSLIKPMLHRLSTISPIPILLSGPEGCGKSRMAKYLAKMNSMHFYEVDCYDLWSEIAGTSEAKIKHAFTKASKYSPCVFFLKNIEILGKDAQADEYDPRVISAFSNCLKKLNFTQHESGEISSDDVGDKKWKNCVQVVASTVNEDILHQNVLRSFLYHFKINMLGNFDRATFFKAISSSDRKLDVLSIDFDNLIKLTNGFTLSDVYHLLALAKNFALTRFTSEYCISNGNFRDYDQIYGYKVDQIDINKALKEMKAEFSMALGTPSIPDVKWDDVGGLNDAKRAIIETIQLAIDYPTVFAGGLRRSGILLYGPPGCGKTLLAKAVANECNLNFISVKGPELLNMYVGQSERNVRELFAKARRCSPCVIFFDEIDALAPSRGRSGDSGGVMDRLVSQLLAEMDGVHSSNDVFVVGATNRVDLVDKSLLRPGRFDQTILVSAAPDAASRFNILSAVTRRLPLSTNDVDLSRLAAQCPAGMTGADFYWLARQAAMNAASRLVEILGGGNGEGGDLDKNGEHNVEIRVENQDFLAALASINGCTNGHEVGI